MVIELKKSALMLGKALQEMSFFASSENESIASPLESSLPFSVAIAT